MQRHQSARRQSQIFISVRASDWSDWPPWPMTTTSLSSETRWAETVRLRRLANTSVRPSVMGGLRNICDGTIVNRSSLVFRTTADSNCRSVREQTREGHPQSNPHGDDGQTTLGGWGNKRCIRDAQGRRTGVGVGWTAFVQRTMETTEGDTERERSHSSTRRLLLLHSVTERLTVAIFLNRSLPNYRPLAARLQPACPLSV